MKAVSYTHLDVYKRQVLCHALLGYDNFAEYNLQERMAQNSESVYKLLDQLLEAYTPTAKQEYAEVQALARQAEGCLLYTSRCV